MTAVGPVPADRARIFVLRPADRDDGGNGGVVVRLDGEKAGRLAYGGFLFFDTDPGPAALAVSGGLSWLGKCELAFEAAPGSTRYFDVGPRRAYQIAALLGGAVGGAAAGAVGSSVYASAGEAVVRGSAEVAAGSAVGAGAAHGLEGAGKRCGGPFQLELVDEAAARERLPELFLSPQK